MPVALRLKAFAFGCMAAAAVVKVRWCGGPCWTRGLHWQQSGQCQQSLAARGAIFCCVQRFKSLSRGLSRSTPILRSKSIQSNFFFILLRLIWRGNQTSFGVKMPCILRFVLHWCRIGRHGLAEALADGLFDVLKESDLLTDRLKQAWLVLIVGYYPLQSTILS